MAIIIILLFNIPPTECGCIVKSSKSLYRWLFSECFCHAVYDTRMKCSVYVLENVKLTNGYVVPSPNICSLTALNLLVDTFPNVHRWISNAIHQRPLLFRAHQFLCFSSKSCVKYSHISVDVFLFCCLLVSGTGLKANVQMYWYCSILCDQQAVLVDCLNVTLKDFHIGFLS